MRWLMSMPGFQRRYPAIELELYCDDQFVDLVADGFDVAIHIASGLAGTSLIARTLTVPRQVLVASPGYIGRHGLPRSAQELEKHQLLTFIGAPSDWALSTARGEALKVTPSGRFSTNYPGHGAQ